MISKETDLPPDVLDKVIKETVDSLSDKTEDERSVEILKHLFRKDNYPSDSRCKRLMDYLEYYKNDEEKCIKVIREWYYDTKDDQKN